MGEIAHNGTRRADTSVQHSYSLQRLQQRETAMRKFIVRLGILAISMPVTSALPLLSTPAAAQSSMCRVEPLSPYIYFCSGTFESRDECDREMLLLFVRGFFIDAYV